MSAAFSSSNATAPKAAVVVAFCAASPRLVPVVGFFPPNAPSAATSPSSVSSASHPSSNAFYQNSFQRTVLPFPPSPLIPLQPCLHRHLIPNNNNIGKPRSSRSSRSPRPRVQSHLGPQPHETHHTQPPYFGPPRRTETLVTSHHHVPASPKPTAANPQRSSHGRADLIVQQNRSISAPSHSADHRPKILADDQPGDPAYMPPDHRPITPTTPNPTNSSTSQSPNVSFQLFGKYFDFPGRYLLYGVPFLWGTFGPAVRMLFAVEPHPGPSVFNTERLLIANAVYFPILLAEISAIQSRLAAGHPFTWWPGKNHPPPIQPSTKQADTGLSAEEQIDPFLSVKAGLELGAWVFLANVAQVLGLEATSAGRAAFLVQLQTVFIPIMAGMLGLNKVGRNTWISSMIAISGVALLSLDKGHGSQSSLTGDSLEILSAFFFSVYVIRLGGYCNRVDPGPLIAVKILVQAALSSLWALGVEAWSLTSHPVMHSPDGPVPWTLHALIVNVVVIAWTGIMSSAASGWLQTKGQQFVSASESAVIFATQPLWASATAAVLLGESFGVRGIAGGGLIILATAFAALSEANKKEKV